MISTDLEQRRRRRSAVTSALVMISTDGVAHLLDGALRGRGTRRGGAPGPRVFAIGSRCSAQSKALSPPPTITTSLPAYGAKLGTKNSMPAPSQPSPAGSGRGLNLPMPGGDQHRPGARLGAVVEPDGDAVVVVAPASARCGRGSTSGSPVAGLLDQPVDQVAALDDREAGDVEDLPSRGTSR